MPLVSEWGWEWGTQTSECERQHWVKRRSERSRQKEVSETVRTHAAQSSVHWKKIHPSFRGELQDPSPVSQSDSRLHPSSPCCIFIESDKWVLILWVFCLLTCSETFFTAVPRCEEVHLVYSVNRWREGSENPRFTLATNHKINVGFLCAHTLQELLNSNWDYF